jgi:ribbon-helix-helix protein
MEDSIRWTVKVSPETDRSLRSYLGQHGMKKGDLSKFIERAVQKEILTQTASEIKQRNADLSGEQLQTLIDEAVAAVRNEARPNSRSTVRFRETVAKGKSA